MLSKWAFWAGESAVRIFCVHDAIRPNQHSLAKKQSWLVLKDFPLNQHQHTPRFPSIALVHASWWASRPFPLPHWGVAS